MTADVIIVGAGAIGLASAWRATRRGLRVTVVDPEPGGGASSAAAGMLAPVTEVRYGEEALLRLAVDSAARYPAFVEELEEVAGQEVGYRTCGMIAVALDAGDRAVLEDLGAFQRSLALDVEPRSGRELRRLEPLLAPSVQGGLDVAGDHQVDPRQFVAALLAAVERAGADLVRQRVARVVTDGGRATGVQLGDGTTLVAGTVVLAAGCRSGEIDGVPDAVRPPVRPVKGQILRLQVPPAYRPFLSRSVRGIVRGSSVYLVPRVDGELVIGATQEELGFDEQVTAGGVYELLRDAHELVPAVTELPLVEVRAGLRPGTPDNAPVVGPTEVPGLVLATGHFRQGILLTPVTADAVAALLADGVLPEPMAAYSPARFQRSEVSA